MISRVDEPTQWCTAMVVASKRNLRICVDFQPLNECVLREVYPLPKVEETLAQLTGATVFSKVDANCGFGRFHSPNTLDNIPRLSCHLADFVLINCPSAYQVPQSTSRSR